MTRHQMVVLSESCKSLPTDVFQEQSVGPMVDSEKMERTWSNSGRLVREVDQCVAGSWLEFRMFCEASDSSLRSFINDSIGRLDHRLVSEDLDP